MLTTKKLLSFVKDLNACQESTEWLSEFKGTPEKAWEQCERGDWMLWLLARLKADRKKIVSAACGCARLSLDYVPKGEDRSRVAIETAEAWVRSEVSLEDLNNAAGAAWAAWAAAGAAVLKQCANITRQYFTFNEVLELIEELQNGN